VGGEDDSLPPYTVMMGADIDRMTDAELDALPRLPLVVTRSSPDSKVKLVQALRRRGRVMAMTGDGVNDAPAIRAADVGVAMGKSGSDVTRGVADIVLTDDNFASIVAAVREGRRIFDSVQHFILHLLSGNMAEAIALMLSLAFVVDDDDKPVFVLGPLAILFLNTVTGSGPAIGLALDPPSKDVMGRPPVRHGLFSRRLLMDCAFYGTIMGILTLGAFAITLWLVENGELGEDCNVTEGIRCGAVKHARATAFLVLNTLLLLHAYTCRHISASAFSRSWVGNPTIFWSLIGGTGLAFVLMYVPYLADEVFKQNGGGVEWGLAVVAILIYFASAEAWKARIRWQLDHKAKMASTQALAAATGDEFVGGWRQGQTEPAPASPRKAGHANDMQSSPEPVPAGKLSSPPKPAPLSRISIV
jgi:magnesium-transporting ATPase (P-type)